MKFKCALLGALVACGASVAQAGEAVIFITEAGKPLSNMTVNVDGKEVDVQENGFVKLQLQGGSHRVKVNQLGELQGEFNYDQSIDQNAEITIDLSAEQIVPDIKITGAEQSAVVPGTISGVLTASETGKSIEGATIQVEGTSYLAKTDSNGRYQIEMPKGTYNLQISHPKYVKMGSNGVHVFAGTALALNMDMRMPGSQSVDSIVLEGAAIAETQSERKRESNVVMDTVGNEEMARTGDTTAAAAVKRVVGVTIADGKYAMVRGLNERYNAVQFNGGNIPSPDSSRRVVPLDIFPAGIISNIDIQKSGAANHPADSAGATIDILSKPVVEDFQGKLTVSTAFVDVTGEHHVIQKTKGSEVLGFGSSDRSLGGAGKGLVYKNPSNLSGVAAGSLLDLSQLKTERQHVDPDASVELTVGDVIGEYDNVGTLTYKVTGKYTNEWDKEDASRASYNAVGNGAIEEGDEYQYMRITNDILLSSGLALNLAGDDYNVASNTLILRQTQNDNIDTKGIRGEDRNFTVTQSYAWREREFNLQQFLGDYSLDVDYPTVFDGVLTFANANLDSPDSRNFVFIGDVAGSIDNVYNPLANDLSATTDLSVATKPTRNFTELKDDSQDISLNSDTTFIDEADYVLKLQTGLTHFNRDRNSDSYEFAYLTPTSSLPLQFQNIQNVSQILNMQNFAANQFEVTSTTNFQGSYNGTWNFQAFYVQPSFELVDIFKASLGFRQEDSSLKLETARDPASGKNIVAEVADKDIYPSLNLTYYVIDDLQLRFSYYESINRPDFREVAPAQYVDPLSGDLYQGNPNLLASNIDNMDVRLEYYFSDAESVTFALFNKDFDNAIERTTSVIAGSSNDLLFSYSNASKGYAKGVEMGVNKDFDTDIIEYQVSANASYFDTEVEIKNASGFVAAKRQMQGQPDMLFNVQLLLNENESGREYTLVFNQTGESLDAVSANTNLPDYYRNSRLIVDFNFKQPVIEDEFDIKFGIKNLLDSEVAIEQANRMVRKYKPGAEYKLSAVYSF